MTTLKRWLKLKSCMKISGNRVWVAAAYGYLAFIAIASATVFYYTRFGQGNDFPIFYRAGLAMHSLGDPWLTSSDSTYSIYLNGPNTSLFFLLISYLSLEQGLLLVRILTVCSIPAISYIVLRKFNNTSFVWSTSILLLCTFPVRANLEYGSLFVIYTGVAFAAYNFSQRSQTWSTNFLIGLLIGLCIDYKPHSFIILLLLIQNAARVIGFFTTLLMGSIISILFTNAFPYSRWLQLISERGESTFKSPDQMSILGVAWELGVPLWLPFSLMFFIVAVVAFKILRYWFPENYRVLVGLGTLAITWLNFFLHPTDLMLAPLLVILIILCSVKSKSYKIYYLALGSSLVWSNSIWIQIIILLLILCFASSFNQMKHNIIWLLVPSFIFTLSILLFPKEENVVRHLINYFPVAFSFLYFDLLLGIAGIRMRNLRTRIG